jgi:hypothetical protein
MPNKQPRRALRMIVWGTRAVGWILIALAVISAPRIDSLAHLGASARAFSSLALGFLGIVWIIAVELFLRFFDKFLSRN